MTTLKEMETPTPEQVPQTVEGIAIHLSYINKNLDKLNIKMDLMQTNTVNREEWNEHLKQVGDIEMRLRNVEKYLWIAFGGLTALQVLLKFFIK